MKHKFHFIDDPDSASEFFIILRQIVDFLNTVFSSVHKYNGCAKRCDIEIRADLEQKKGDLKAIDILQPLLKELFTSITTGKPNYEKLSTVLTVNYKLIDRVVVNKDQPIPSPQWDILLLSKFIIHCVSVLYVTSGIDALRYIKICSRCGTAFLAPKRHKKFCSNACMAPVSRRRRNVAKTTREARQEVASA